MATHSSILAWRIPWTEEPLHPQGRRESDMAERLSTHTLCILHRSHYLLRWFVSPLGQGAYQLPVPQLLSARSGCSANVREQGCVG